jgi:hypothetical protein
MRPSSGGAVPPEFVSLFFRPFGAESVPTRYPRLAPWALILRRFAAISSWAHLATPFDFAHGRLSRLFRAGLNLATPFDFAHGRLSRVFRGSYVTFELALELAIQTPPGLASFHFYSRRCRAGLLHIAAPQLRSGTVLSSENIYNLFTISMLDNRGVGNPAILLDKQPLKFLQLALNGFKC